MSVYENIQSGKYKQAEAYPHRPPKPPQMMKRASELTCKEIEELLRLIKEHEKAVADNKAAQIAWRSRENELMSLFENDCAIECRVENHPKRAKLWQMAWEYGHAHGLSEVLIYYKRLAELLQ